MGPDTTLSAMWGSVKVVRNNDVSLLNINLALPRIVLAYFNCGS